MHLFPIDFALVIAAVDGWVIFVTGLNEETATEDLADICGEYGDVRNTWMNLDRQTGFVKV